jgi:hypothetical protein
MNFKSPEIHRTPLYRARAAYRLMGKRCGNANGKNPVYVNVELRMTMKQFLSWAVPRYVRFIKKHPDWSPVCARKGDRGHYEIGNIEIISAAENSRRQIRDKPASRKHGTLSSYRYCRCDLCKEVWRKHNEEYRRSLGVKPRNPVGPVHGTRNSYVYHKCRCEACMKANRDYSKKLRVRQS